VLDDFPRANGSLVRVLPVLTTGSALTEQVPALVQGHLERRLTATLFIGQRMRRTGFEGVFLGDQFMDPLQQFLVVHHNLLVECP